MKSCSNALIKAMSIMFGIVVSNIMVHAQSAHSNIESEPKNIFVLSFGYTHIPAGADLHAENTEGFFVPSIGLDYGRVIAEKWEVGVMLDIELDHYLIYEEEFERENAFVAVGGVAYNITDHLCLIGGLGAEFEKNKHQFVARLGTEYVVHFGKHWGLAPAFYFDWKEKYETYALSLGLRYGF